MKKIIPILLLIVAPGILAGMETSPVGIALIQNYEGLALKAYKCPAGVYTIGYGNTRFAEPGKRITKEQAIAYLKYDLNRFENYIIRTIPRSLKWYEYDALVSFCFNLGYRLKGRLRQAIIAQQTPLVVHKIKLYVKARVGGKLKTLRGLVKRRNDEALLYERRLRELSFWSDNKFLTWQQKREAVWCNYR